MKHNLSLIALHTTLEHVTPTKKTKNKTLLKQISGSNSNYILVCVLCSRSVYRGPITLFSRTSGVWVCLWLKWPLAVSLSHHLMLRNWNRFLASLWKGRQPPLSPPQSHGPLGDQASVSLSSFLNSGSFEFRKVC